jgi:hypothetical protein
MTDREEEFESVARYTARLLNVELSQPVLRPDVQFAVAMSTATRIEPELIRAVRLEVLPHLDVGAEADFWFSQWIGPRRPHVVALRSDLLPTLRSRLRSWYAASGPDDHIRKLGEVVAWVHENSSPALVLEEAVTWQATTGIKGGAQVAAGLLRRATRAMVDDKRYNLADWVAGAVERLPREVVDTPDGWHLVLSAKRLRPNDIRETPDVGALIRDGQVGEVLGPPTHVPAAESAGTCSVEWDDEILVIRTDGPAMIPLPAGMPPMVEVMRGAQERGEWLDLSAGILRIDPVGLPLKLRTLEGKTFRVPNPARTVQSSAVLVPTPGLRGRHAELWLQPVRFQKDLRATWGHPTAVLTRVLDSVPLNGEAVGQLRRWRDGKGRARLRLVHGRDKADRVRLANQFAEDCKEEGWRVYRGRQDPDVADQLPIAPTTSDASGVIVVIDDADAWHPAHLVPLLDTTDQYAVIRVLLLADRPGPWWQAVVRTISGRGVTPNSQELPSHVLDPVNASEVLLHATKELSGLLELNFEEFYSVLTRFWRGGPERPEKVAVAVGLDVAEGRRPAVDQAGAGRVILRHEHEHRRLRGRGVEGKLGRLVFLAVLMQPLRHEDARTLCLHWQIVRDATEWIELFGEYERFYPEEEGYLDPFGSTELGEDLLAAALVDGDPSVGVDPAWAKYVLRDMVEAELPSSPVCNAFGVLARAGHRYLKLAVEHLHPLVRLHPKLLVGAGGAAIRAAITHASTDLLEVISSALPAPADRSIELDPAAADLEEMLVAHRLSQGKPTAERNAPLRLRLARSLAQAGRLEKALDNAELASEDYDRLVTKDLRNHTPDLCESLVLESVLLGELGRSAEALARAELAEKRWNRFQARANDDRPGANLGLVLANLARQKAREGSVPGALADAEQAVEVLRNLEELRPEEFRTELTDALVIAAERFAEAGSTEQALARATSAVEHATKLVARNAWAHEHRLAAARLCLSAQQNVPEAALAETEQAVMLYLRAAAASPERFELPLAGALVQQAEHLLAARGPEDALGAAEQAVALCRPRAQANQRAHGEILARSLLTLGRVLARLGRRSEAERAASEVMNLVGDSSARHARELSLAAQRLQEVS